MPREPKTFKILRKKPEPLPEPESKTKSKPKAKKESSSQYKQEEKQKSTEKLKQNAEKLKQNPSKSDLLISEKLDEQKIKFKYRAIVHGYIPNFYFPKYKKVIVLDGKQFRDKERQSVRDKTFDKHGVKIYRVNPRRLFKQTDWIVEEIISFLTGKPISPRRNNRKKKVRAAQYKTPEDYLVNPELTLEELKERLEDPDFLDKTLSKIEKRKWYY